MSSAHSSSPLWLVTNEPDVNALVSDLDAMRRRIEAFGVKAVVGDPDAVRALHEALLALQWDAAALEKHGVPVLDALPLFGFYRDLLRWLFLSPDEPSPTFEAVEIVLRD